jgi:peptidyl-prolyl cis-trans isomerase D
MLSQSLKQKKAELIKAKWQVLQEAIATATGSKVEQATDVTLANPVLAGGVGQEPRVVGNAFS